MLSLLLACSTPAEEGASDYDIDLRLTEDDIPAGEDGDLVWWGPEVVVEPYTDVMYCQYGTYEGEDIALEDIAFWQNSFGHHLILYGTTASTLDIADGEIIDCTDTGEQTMTSMEPLLIPSSYNGEVLEEMVLPDGMAYKLREGQRYVIQAHYVNTSSDRILVQDPMRLQTTAVDAVETWVSPLVVNHQQFSIPAGSSLTSSYECDFDQDYSLLYLLGHMHEWGRSMKIELVSPAEEITEVYAVEAWEPYFRDDPPINGYSSAPLLLEQGTRMRVTCTWDNTEDAAIGFPDEMCVAVTMAYPALTDTICSD